MAVPSGDSKAGSWYQGTPASSGQPVLRNELRVGRPDEKGTKEGISTDAAVALRVENRSACQQGACWHDGGEDQHGVLSRCGLRGTIWIMQPLKAQVRNGRLVLDAPTDLPEGTELDLVPADALDDLDDDDRRRLHEALRCSEDDVAAGRVVPADEFLAELRRS